MFHNVVIGTPLVEPWELFSTSKEDFEKFELKDTLFTDERFLPAVLVEAGVVPSRNEVRRNKPELYKFLNGPDFIEVKWGKNKIFIAVGK